jgi:hypothetical protein
MAAQWQDVYREVVYRLRKIQQSAPTSLWQNVLEEVIKRWQARQEFRDGKVNSEVTVKINVADEHVADKALGRIAEFARQFDGIETDDVKVIMLGQKYRKDGNIAVLLRIRIVGKTQKSRSKIVASADDV